MTTTRSGHNFKDFAVLEIPKEGEPHYFLEQPCSIIDTGSKLVIEFEVHFNKIITRIYDLSEMKDQDDFENERLDCRFRTNIVPDTNVAFVIKDPNKRSPVIIQSDSPYYESKKILHKFGFINNDNSHKGAGFRYVEYNAELLSEVYDIKVEYGYECIFSFIKKKNDTSYQPLFYYHNLNASINTMEALLSKVLEHSDEPNDLLQNKIKDTNAIKRADIQTLPHAA